MWYIYIRSNKECCGRNRKGTFHNPKEAQRKDSAEVTAKSSSNG